MMLRKKSTLFIFFGALFMIFKISAIIMMEVGMMKKFKQEPHDEQENKKDEGNNQWTNANLKYYPDERERRDGPGGEDGE